MSEPAASAVLSFAVPALPALQYLEVWADPHEERRHVPLLSLAVKMREGRLPHLRNVAAANLPGDAVSTLNRLAQRDVFELL